MHLALAVLWAGPTLSVTLDDYLAAVHDYHPVFTSETLRYEVEFKRQQALEGDEDWTLALNPAYDYDEPLQNRFAVPKEARNLHMSASLQREVWKTGGRLGLTYDYNYNDSELAPVFLPIEGAEPVDITGPAKFFDNAVGMTYTHPLLRNRGGTLDSLEADLQDYTARQTVFDAYETQETFLQSAALLFLDWALIVEQLRIGEERLKLAKEELADTKKKHDVNLVEKVNVHRAEDAVLVAEQGIRQLQRESRAVQLQLAFLAGRRDKPYQRPEFDLYQTYALPDADAEVEKLAGGSRVLKQLDLRVRQIEREIDGLDSVSKASLDVVLSGGLKDGAVTYSDSTGFDHPNVGAALTYQYPLGNHGAKAELERAKLDRMRAQKIREGAAIELESAARVLLVRIEDHLPVLVLNRARIETAAQKTKEEVRLFEQGRNEFTFVIQSRDAEARAKLSYAENATLYQRFIIEFRALTDQLFKPDTGE